MFYKLLAISLVVVIIETQVSRVCWACEQDWQQYKSKFAKHYANPIEDARRRILFEQTHETIARVNERPESSVKLAHNRFSDWTPSEMARMFGGAPTRCETLNRAPTPDQWHMGSMVAPDELDWRKSEGVVTEVKSQGECGSCWAFATTGVLEGQQRKVNLSLSSLSEQNLIDCSHSGENKGCAGGDPFEALGDIGLMGGIQASESYPYEARDGVCRFNDIKAVMRVAGFTKLTSADEALLKRVVASFGPVAVNINADFPQFRNYDSGVVDQPECERATNHAVLVVGYGTEVYGANGTKSIDYWLVKNSWGASWGDRGYVKMARNRDNQCGIASCAVIPFVEAK